MRRLVATVGLVLILAPAPAWADGLIIPFAGAVFDPETNELLGRETEPTYGAAVGFMVDGKLGFEYDFSYTSKFFPESQGFTDNRLMTSMFNVIYGVPIGEYPVSTRSRATIPWVGKSTVASPASSLSRASMFGRWPTRSVSSVRSPTRRSIHDGGSDDCRPRTARESDRALHSRQNASAVCRARSLPLCQMAAGFTCRAAASRARRRTPLTPASDRGRCGSSSLETASP